jgi:transcriptional regulator with XRE-family HTH domain
MFGSEMRRLREQSGMSLAQLSGIVNSSTSSLHRIETAESMIPKGLPGQLDAAFGVDGWFTNLYALASIEAHPDRYRRWMELETRARRIDGYAGHYVPGLLQTEGYARAVLASGNPAEAVPDLLAARLDRQGIRCGDRPPFMTVVLDEAVIRRAIGGREVMREQLETLLPLVHSEISTVQVLPFHAGEHPLLGGALNLLTLDDGTVVAYEESIASGTLYEDAESIEIRRRKYDRVRANALSATDSAAALRAAMEDLSR